MRRIQQPCKLCGRPCILIVEDDAKMKTPLVVCPVCYEIEGPYTQAWIEFNEKMKKEIEKLQEAVEEGVVEVIKQLEKCGQLPKDSVLFKMLSKDVVEELKEEG